MTNEIEDDLTFDDVVVSACVDFDDADNDFDDEEDEFEDDGWDEWEDDEWDEWEDDEWDEWEECDGDEDGDLEPADWDEEVFG